MTIIAAVSNYVLQQYGNPSVTVTAADLATIRQGGPTPLLAKLVSVGPLVLVLLVIVVGIGLWMVMRRRRHEDVADLHAR